MELSWVHDTAALSRIGREQPLRLCPSTPQGARRQALETFIATRFHASHAARVRHFMPCLLGLFDDRGQIAAAVGLRHAGSQALFLERYLDQPVEACIQTRGSQPVAREQIVEVGNLAAADPGAARLLIVALTDLLVAQGLHWVAFTGTPMLRNSFRRLGLQPQSLGLADPARLGAERADWGHYYDSQPQVLAGNIRSGHQCLLQQGIYARLGYQALYDLAEMPDVACS